MTYAQELLQEGKAPKVRLKARSKAKLKEQIEMIESLLRTGVGWPIIVQAIGVDEEKFAELQAESARLQAQRRRYACLTLHRQRPLPKIRLPQHHVDDHRLTLTRNRLCLQQRRHHGIRRLDTQPRRAVSLPHHVIVRTLARSVPNELPNIAT